MEFKPFLSRDEASAYIRSLGLDCPNQYLAYLAHQGAGPRYTKWGRRTVYRREDLDAWIAERTGCDLAEAS